MLVVCKRLVVIYQVCFEDIYYPLKICFVPVQIQDLLLSAVTCYLCLRVMACNLHDQGSKLILLFNPPAKFSKGLQNLLAKIKSLLQIKTSLKLKFLSQKEVCGIIKHSLFGATCLQKCDLASVNFKACI